MMTYEETLEYIHNINWRSSRKGLWRTKELLRKMGNPEKALKFVHVAGTNGKGSTSASLESILRKAGYKTGLYTSPFVIRFNERMQINGEQIADEELSKITEYVRPLADSMEDHPTEFEIITAIAMKYFKDNECDIVILEVGMGGELDSTNVIDPPELAVITAMGYDHVKELGPDMRHIAMAKAGIIKDDTDVVIYGGNAEADKVFEEVCRKKGARLHKTDFTKLLIHKYDLEYSIIDFGKYKNIRLSLAGTYQPYNMAVVITAIELLRNKGFEVSDESIYEGLSSVRWPGRFELLRRDPIFMIDGAHNPHGINAAVESIKALFGDKKPVFLVGIMADKDVIHMAEKISCLAKSVVTVRPDNHRAMDASELANCFIRQGASAISCDTIDHGVETAMKEAGKDGIVIALGSLYFSGDVRASVAKLSK